MVDVWNIWHEDYLKADFPRVFIRYEDLLFRQEEIARKVCGCVGGEWTSGEGFNLYEKNVKAENFRVGGRQESLEKYSSREIRFAQFSEIDLEYAKEHISERLMAEFNYWYDKS